MKTFAYNILICLKMLLVKSWNFFNIIFNFISFSVPFAFIFQCVLYCFFPNNSSFLHSNALMQVYLSNFHKKKFLLIKIKKKKIFPLQHAAATSSSFATLCCSFSLLLWRNFTKKCVENSSSRGKIIDMINVSLKRLKVLSIYLLFCAKSFCEKLTSKC